MEKIDITEGNKIIQLFLKEVGKGFVGDVYFNMNWEFLMEVITEMNKRPWWHEYNSDSLAIALVSASIEDAWEIVVKAIIKYENIQL